MAKPHKRRRCTVCRGRGNNVGHVLFIIESRYGRIYLCRRCYPNHAPLNHAEDFPVRKEVA